MKKILVLHTGGTISMSEDDNGAVSPNASNPLNQFNNPFDQQLELVTEDIFNIPSPHVGPTEMLALEQRILRLMMKSLMVLSLLMELIRLKKQHIS